MVTDISVEGCHFIQGPNGNATTLTGIVALTNCQFCKALHNYFDNVLTIHIVLVGSSTSGNHGNMDEVAFNYSTGSSGSSIAVINNTNFNIHHNAMRQHGTGSSGYIDLESNTTQDFMELGNVGDNVLDCSDGSPTAGCYGITLQSGGPFVRHLKIHDNIIFGLLGSGNNFREGITATGTAAHNSTDVEIYNNQISYASDAGIDVGGADRMWIHDNQLICTGTGLILTQFMDHALVERNVLRAPQGLCFGGNAPWTTIQLNQISEKFGNNTNNIFRGNVASRLNVTGTGDLVLDMTDDAITGTTHRAPNGFTNFAGGLATNPLTAPPLTSQNGALGTCNLTAGTWFYQLTALDATGLESAGGSERSFLTGGGNGCPILTWTFVPGASSYNLYRGSTSGSEVYIASIAGTDRTYSDLGGQTTGAAVPTVNMTGNLVASHGGSASKAICWKADGKTLGFCSTQPDATGACTCN
jgi:hypothetical protein